MDPIRIQHANWKANAITWCNQRTIALRIVLRQAKEYLHRVEQDHTLSRLRMDCKRVHNDLQSMIQINTSRVDYCRLMLSNLETQSMLVTVWAKQQVHNILRQELDMRGNLVKQVSTVHVQMDQIEQTMRLLHQRRQQMEAAITHVDAAILDITKDTLILYTVKPCMDMARIEHKYTDVIFL